MKWTASSVRHFMDIKDNHRDEINSMIIHNYELFKSKTENEMKVFYMAFPKIDIDHIDFMGPL